MSEATFLPPRNIHRRVAPVNLWRGHPIAGAVNDQNAARLGGVAGHAGLFATGRDAALYAQSLLRNGLARDGKRVFLAGTVTTFTRRAAKNRALGWESRDTTTTDNAGRLMGPETFGHTGFTGTSIWIDPVRGVFAVLLTNRVFAPRSRKPITRLKQIRGQVADAAVLMVEPGCRPLVAVSTAAKTARC